MNVNLYVIEDYRKIDDFLVRINKPNCRKGKKLMQIVYLQRIMKNNADMGSKKTNPIQTQSKPVLSAFILSFVEVVEWANLKLEAKRRSLRLSFSESSNREPILQKWNITSKHS